MNADAFQQETGGLITISCGGDSKLVAKALSRADGQTTIAIIDPDARKIGRKAGLDGNGIQYLNGLPGLPSANTEAIFYSLPGLVSVADPLPVLFDLFLGLRERQRVPIRQVDADELRTQLGDLVSPLSCVIDLSGAEIGILETLEFAGILEKLSVLELRCGVEPFFEGSKSSAEITAWLEERSFAISSVDSDDPDWPVLKFTAEPNARRIKELEAEIAKSAEQKAADLKLVASEIERLKEQTETYEKELQEAHATAAEKTKVIETLETQLSEIKSEVEEKSEIIALQDTRLDATTRDVEALKSHLDAEKDTATQLQQDHAALRDEIKAMQHLKSELEDTRKAVASRDEAIKIMNGQLQSMREEASQKSEQLSLVQKQLDHATEEHGFQSRVNAMLQLDLDNLRKNFAVSEDTRREQEALLLKLTPKLAQAAEHLKRLKIVSVEETPTLEQVEDEPVEVTPPKRTSRRTSTGTTRSKRKTKQGQ